MERKGQDDSEKWKEFHGWAKNGGKAPFLMPGFPPKSTNLWETVAPDLLCGIDVKIGDRRRFQLFLERWQKLGIKGSLDRMIEHPSLHHPPPEWPETDIYDYGVERILIVERDILVDVFVRNGLHAQERMLVLSESGYPDYLIPLAQRCLRDNPEVPVYLLHDAARHGPTMSRRIQVADFLPLEGHPVLDLGLFPNDVKRMPNLKALQLHKREFAVPVDVLLYATLGAGIAQAMAQNLAFGELLHPSGWVTSFGGVDGDFG